MPSLAKRSGSDSTQPLQVPLVFRGTAVAGADYKTIPATVTIPAGENDYWIKVKAMGNGASDSTVTLTIKIKGQKGVTSKSNVIILP